MHVTLLGEQLLAGADGTIQARSSRTIALIAFLVAHGDAPQTRQRIAAAFWPDSSDEQALTNLRRELHHLRGVLGDEPALVVTPRDLAWRDSPTCVVDVRAFRSDRAAALAAAAGGDRDTFLTRAAAAVARYGGEFLPGNDDDWARDTRSELEQQCVDLLDRCIAAYRATGDLTRAVDAARRRLQLRPLEEAGYRTLMELQGDQGDRAGAVSTYHHCASVLERELGVEPDPLTRTTLNRLLARSGPAVAATPEPPAPRTVRAGRRFVGRAPELRALRERWRAAADGTCRARPAARRPRRRQVPVDGRAGRRGPPRRRRGGGRPVLRHLRASRARSGCGLAAHAGRPRRPAVGRPGVAGRGGAPAAPGPDPRGAGAARAAGDGRRLAAPPLLRGPEPSAARGRPARPPDDRQPAVVRPGDVVVHDVLPRPRRARSRPDGRDDAGRSRPVPRGLGRPDARDGPAHRDRSRPVRGRRHGRARRGRHRERADRSRGGPAARDDGRVPALHRRGRARRRGVARERPAGVGAAEQAGPGERGGPRHRRTRRRRRPRRHPRPAHRGRRPPRRRRGPRGRRAVAQPHPARGRWRLRLLPRPAPRRRLRGREPAAALAAAPARRAGPGAAARRRPRLRVRAARRAVRPRWARRPGGRLLPPGRRRRLVHVRSRRGDQAARGRAGDRARDAGRAGPDEPGARPRGVAGEAPDRPLRLRLAAGPGGAGAIDRPGGHARAARLRPGRARRAVVVAVRARGHRGRPPHGDARAGDRDSRLPDARTGALRLRGLGRQPGPAHRVRGALRPGRRVRRRAYAERRHPGGRARPRLGRARALAARPRGPGPGVRHRRHRARPRRATTSTASPSHWPTAPSPTSSAGT